MDRQNVQIWRFLEDVTPKPAADQNGYARAVIMRTLAPSATEDDDLSARAIQAWQQDWPRKLADSTLQRVQLTWDQPSGSYLKESWSLVR